MRAFFQPIGLALVATVCLAGCGDEEEKAEDAEAKADRTAVSSGGDEADATNDLTAKLEEPTPPELGDGVEPEIPNLGGDSGRLVKGWEGLRRGSTAADLRKIRPKARASDLSGLVYSETLDKPWIAASYRFDRLTSHLAQVLWLAGPGARGEAVYRDMLKQGLHRWRRRPKITGNETDRRSSWRTKDGEIFLSMVNATGRISLEWKPTPDSESDALEQALAKVSGKNEAKVATRAPATSPLPTRPDGAPPRSRP